MENLRFTKTDFSWCGLVIVEVSSVEKERKKCIDFRLKFIISFKNVMLRFLRRKRNMYALKHLKRFFRQLRKNRKIVESEFIDNVILRRSCDLTRKIVCAQLKISGNGSKRDGKLFAWEFLFLCKSSQKFVKPSSVKIISITCQNLIVKLKIKKIQASLSQ